jgi:hypothetical protein
MQGEMIDI